MPRNYSVTETIRQAKERQLQKESAETIDTDYNVIADNTEEIVVTEVTQDPQSYQVIEFEEYVEQTDKKEILDKKDTIIQSIVKKFKLW